MFVIYAFLIDPSRLALGYIGLFVPSSMLWYKSKQYESLARTLDIPHHMLGNLVLYLRAFVNDTNFSTSSFISHNPFSTTREEQIAVAVRPLGTLIAIGNPREKLPMPGGFQIYEREGDWREAVLSLMKNAKAIILEASNTPGLLWEVGKAVEVTNPEHFVISVDKMSKNDYIKFSNICSINYNLNLPYVTPNRGGLIFFGPDWTAVFQPLKAPFWRRPFYKNLQAKLVYSLRPLFEACDVPWAPPPFSLLKLLIMTYFLFYWFGLPIIIALIKQG